MTDLLGIEYPIIQASMAWITDAELAAAVSKAGGLGTIGPNAGSKAVTRDIAETGERLREQIRRCKDLTDRPFAVNFLVGVIGWDRDFSDECVKVGIEERVPVAIVSQGSPAVYTERLKNAGMKVVHVCSTVRHVKKAEEMGVDAVIASGTEGGGHSGFDQITTLCLIPQAVDAVEIPVIAGGGIVDARGLMGALSLGAEGVYMGTRFMATKECPTHPNVKRAILEAKDTSTMAIRHGSPVPIEDERRGNRGFVEERRGSLRMLLDDYVIEMLSRKDGAASLEEALNTPGAPEESLESNRTVSAFVFGELEANPISAGQGAGMINDIPTCRELMERMVGGAESILERLNTIASRPTA
jgi:NAD(P)H-dependent flavin oxidoreductase YrpB (nitropropane dioxygenase family)